MRVAEARIAGYGEAQYRRQIRLQAVAEDDAAESTDGIQHATLSSEALRPTDKYGLNLDEFNNTSTLKPYGWKQVVANASEVHIDEMRTLLEYHYDECHEESWRLAHLGADTKQAPKRKSDFKVFRSVLDKKHQRKTKQIALPDNIKSILRKPPDEQSWEKLEAVRHAIVSELQWLTRVTDAQMLDAMGLAVLNAKKSLQEISKTWKGGALSKADLLDRLLLVLWDALFARQAHEWTGRGVANITVSEAMDLGRWFLRGQKVGEKPLFDAICAMCGELLHGDLNQSFGNKTCGPPIDRDGEQIPWSARHNECAGVTVAEETSTILKDPAGGDFYRDAARRQAYMNEVGGIELPMYSQCAFDHYHVVVLHLGATFEGPDGPFLDGKFPARWGAFKAALEKHAKANPEWAGNKGVTGKISHLRFRGRGPKAFLRPTDVSGSDLGPQPPFLLRWSPSFFAREAGAVFEHDDDTNRLSLREGAWAPWLRKQCPESDERKWLYCQACSDKWFPQRGRLSFF